MIWRLISTEIVVFVAALFVVAVGNISLPEWLSDLLVWVFLLDFVAFVATLIWAIWK